MLAQLSYYTYISQLPSLNHNHIAISVRRRPLHQVLLPKVALKHNAITLHMLASHQHPVVKHTLVHVIGHANHAARATATFINLAFNESVIIEYVF